MDLAVILLAVPLGLLAGGFVTVDSAPGHGTTFRLYLPVYEELGERRKDE